MEWGDGIVVIFITVGFVVFAAAFIGVLAIYWGAIGNAITRALGCF